MTEMNYLLSAIERLTLPHRTLVAQQNDAGIGCVSEVHHQALLKQLKAAIGGNVGRHAASQQAREKTPINLQAFEKFKEIATQVKKWRATQETTRRPVYEELWIALGRWYLGYENERRKGRISRDAEAAVERTILGWVRDVDNIFDPPNIVEITKRCPICFESWAYNTDGDLVTAVVIEYRNLGHDTLTYANGHCRACEHIWHGISAIRWLSYELEHPALSPAEMAEVERFGLHEPERVEAEVVTHEDV